MQVALKLRLEGVLREKLEAAATRAKRSMNTEIIARLEASLIYLKDIEYSVKYGEPIVSVSAKVKERT